jgi:squalene-associated FAD-dependent desaturase
MRADVVILGGGLSGLAAAIELSGNGRAVTIVEQAPRLGGRCYSYVDRTTGDVVDNGQHVLIGAYHETLRYLEAIGTRAYLRASPALRLMMHHPSKGFCRFEVRPLPRPLHLTAAMLRYSALSLRDRTSLLRVGADLQRKSAEGDQMLGRLTVDQWLTRLNQSAEAKRSLWNPIAISVMNEIPERASALLFARSLRAAFLGKKSDSAILIPSIGQTELYVTPARKLLAKRGGKILLNAEVTGMHAKGGRIDRIVLRNGKEFAPSCVVSALPAYALERIIPAGGDGARMRPGYTKLSYAPIVSMHLWYDKNFMDEPVVGSIGTTLQWIFNRRLLLDDAGKSPAFVSAVISGAYDAVGLSKRDLVKTAQEELAALFPESRSAKLLHAVVIKEKRATFSPTNDINELRPGAKTEYENLALAGDWTDTGLPATIEGAIMSGYAAASLCTTR